MRYPNKEKKCEWDCTICMFYNKLENKCDSDIFLETMLDKLEIIKVNNGKT